MASKPNEEPPAGIQGKGTIDEPYDQGNAPENISSKTAPTAGTSSQPISTTAKTQTPSAAVTAADKASSKEQKGESRGRENLKAPARPRHEERDVSPGTMPDGSHATTSGERGESYEPGKLSRLKGVFSMGKH